jgi:hypothetical protein
VHEGGNMARTTQNFRDRKGRYIKITVLNKIKLFCNTVITKLEKERKENVLVPFITRKWGYNEAKNKYKEVVFVQDKE